MPVAIFSPIHLHNAPAGQNGPVLQDIVQDAGGDVNGLALSPEADTGDGNVFNEVIEVDTLISIETVIGQDGAPITTAPSESSNQTIDDTLVLQSAEVEASPIYEASKIEVDSANQSDFVEDVAFESNAAFIPDMFEVA